MRCPFLREAQVKSCQTSAHRKLIVRLPRAGVEELCSSPGWARCPGVREHHEERPAADRCPLLGESLVQYCAAAPVATFVPYNESAHARCGTDASRWCDAYLSLAGSAAAHAPLADGIAVPQALRYARSHLWLALEADGTCHVGIDGLLARALGSVDRVVFLDVGSSRRPSAVATSSGVDLALVSPAPLRGASTNPALRAHPERLVEEPYGRGWLFEAAEATPADGLLTGARALEWMREESARLTERIHALLARPGADGVRLVADGGSFAPGLPSHLAREETLSLFAAFFSAEDRS